jgi:hypothetical protein
MDKFLDTYDLPKPNQGEVKSLILSKMSNDIEPVINSLPIKKTPVLDRFTAEFYQAFEKKLTPLLLKLFCKMEREGNLPNSFNEASITLIPKPDKDTQKRKV